METINRFGDLIFNLKTVGDSAKLLDGTLLYKSN